MVYNYYYRLNRARQRIYERSDALTRVVLPQADAHHPGITRLHHALAQDRRDLVEDACNELCRALTVALGTEPVQVVVEEKRPRRAGGELHGLYERTPDPPAAVITVWMRTARRRQVVAIRTFLRTLLHELCHHLDYTLLYLPESFHTEGFYQRESSLYRQLTDGLDLPSARLRRTAPAR